MTDSDGGDVEAVIDLVQHGSAITFAGIGALMLHNAGAIPDAGIIVIGLAYGFIATASEVFRAIITRAGGR